VAVVTERSDLGKFTLGALIQLLEKKLPREDLANIVDGAKQVNDPWKKLKHGDDPPVVELLTGLRKMLEVLSALPS